MRRGPAIIFIKTLARTTQFIAKRTLIGPCSLAPMQSESDDSTRPPFLVL